MSTLHMHNDGAAVERARSGEVAAFEWLVQRHQQRALMVALGLLRDREDARDACQEAFLRAWRALPRFDGQAQFATWLHRIVVNVCIDRLRRHTPAQVALDDVASTLCASDDPAHRAEGLELGTRISCALNQLSATHRTVLVLREIEGLSYQEIADSMRCSLGTVMSRLFHARKRMQALLLEEPALEAIAA
jgi:RNA polymerase sigma-70 factor (ECF subfamily)